MAGLTVILVASASFSQSTEGERKAANKKICITFDILPAERNYEQADRVEINKGILAALAKHDARATGFVVGDNIESDWSILVAWLEAGHTLGFHTFSGQDIEGVPARVFNGDIIKGQKAIEDILQSYKQKSRYFRFPYLHYGSTKEIKDAVADFLAESKITVAHATIITEDFVYNLSLEKLIRRNDSLEFKALRDEYIAHLLERVARAETLADRIMHRQVRQILQLRANRLSSMFLDDILSTLEDKGYSFISLKTALNDKVYARRDYYYGSKVVSFLERLAAPKPKKEEAAGQ
ncbi:MAG: polysaccharide deacetylase family protein [Candidatus Zixiibacteriota bacterium]|nr:MAG: polysaccharide deacetylase family protein [candidate division Zixibacteria bacterium]